MKKISAVLFTIVVLTFIGCNLDEEKVVNIRVHGYVRDKVTNDPLPGCNIYINNGFIAEEDEYIGETDATGAYDFNRDVWLNYATNISTFCDLIHKDQIIEIGNNKDNEVNFFLELY